MTRPTLPASGDTPWDAVLNAAINDVSDRADSASQLRPYAPDTRPWYLDTYWTVFRGLTMPAAQLTDGTSNSLTTAAAASGALSVTVANGAKFVAKEPVVISGAGYNGTDLVTEVTAISGNVLTIRPAVVTAVPTGTAVTSLWINNAHLTGPGFTYWANCVANAKRAVTTPGINLFPSGSFDTTYTDARAVANVPVGMESLGTATFLKTNFGAAEGGAFARAGSGTQVTSAAVGDGMRTLAAIPVLPGESVTVSAQMSGSYFSMSVVDKANPATVLASGNYNLGGTYTSSFAGAVIGARAWAQFTVPTGVTGVEVRFTSAVASTSCLIDDLRVNRSRQDANTDRYIIEDLQGRPIVHLGDSWGDGFGGATALESALEVRLGPVNYVNACVAGQDLSQMMARFNTDVAPVKPLYVILEYGVNDVSHGLTAAAFKSNQLAAVNACRAIGAIPVILGIPPTAINLATAHDRNEDMRTQVDSWTQ